MIAYIFQIIGFQLAFLLVYDLFLKKETFFNWNRGYLMVSSILSLILPFIKIESFKTAIPKEYIVGLPEVVIGDVIQNNIENSNGITVPIQQYQIGWSWELLLLGGVLIAALVLLYKLGRLIRLFYANEKQWQGNLLLISLKQSNAAFSFFNFVFLGDQLSDEEKHHILTHEMVHATHKHSIDLIWFEVLKIVFWFNPLIYLYQNRITTLHEYIADDEALKRTSKSTYYHNLLSQVFDTNDISFVNPFFKKSLIKTRIIMLSKSKSKQILKFKYALLIPLIFGMLIYSSCAYEAEAPEQNVELDLSQFTYTLKLDEKMSNEKKAIHEKYEAFLKSNAEYVSWANIDKVNNEITYTVHSKAEAVPDGFTSSEVGFPDGSSYISYMNMSYFDFASKSDSDSLRKKQDNISFQTIDWSPTWNSCQSYTDNESRKKCTVQSISKFVNHNFNLKISEGTGLTGVQRISALFNIDKNGEVTDIKVRAPHPDLEREVKRVISAFPKFSPGKNKGEFVEVGYSLPIMFKLQ